MDDCVKDIINSSVKEIIAKSTKEKKLNALNKRHKAKVHFVPKRYRVFGGLLQSMNIQFGNFIEILMTTIISADDKYKIINKYSGKKSNKFFLSSQNEALIDEYITKCQLEHVNLEEEFPKLLEAILKDENQDANEFKHDIDLLFKNKETGVIYYLEIKYNDDHDTGKYIDINRKFIKTYAYLANKLEITQVDQLVPILFYFTNKRLKGNIYLPEGINVKRGKNFFEEFLTIQYKEVDDYLSALSESEETIQAFDDLYQTIMRKIN